MKLTCMGSASAESSAVRHKQNKMSSVGMIEGSVQYIMSLLCEIWRFDLCHCVDWRIIATNVSEGLAASIFRVVHSS